MTGFRLPTTVRVLVLWLVVTGGAGGYLVAAASADVPIVAAATSLNPALNEVAELFRNRTGGAVRVSYGSSGNIARQIIHGAPFEVFLSADENLVLSLVDRSLTIDGGSVYAIGRLALFVPHGSSIQSDNELRDVKTAVSDGRLQRLAIANPQHAPYGRAARQLLEQVGVWDRIEDKLVLGESASQAAQFAVTGSVDAAIFSYSLTLSAVISQRGTVTLLPEQWHQPVRHRMVLLKGAGRTATAFFSFMQEPATRHILATYGFTGPGASR